MATSHKITMTTLDETDFSDIEIDELKTSISGFTSSDFFRIYNSMKDEIPKSNISLDTDYSNILTELSMSMNVDEPTEQDLTELDNLIVDENTSVINNLDISSNITETHSHYFEQSFRKFENSNENIKKTFTIIGALYNTTFKLNNDVTSLTNQISQLQNDNQQSQQTLNLLNSGLSVPGFQAIPSGLVVSITDDDVNGGYKFFRESGKIYTQIINVYNLQETPIVRVLPETGLNGIPFEFVQHPYAFPVDPKTNNGVTHKVSISFNLNEGVPEIKKDSGAYFFLEIRNPITTDSQNIPQDSIQFSNREIVVFNFVYSPEERRIDKEIF